MRRKQQHFSAARRSVLSMMWARDGSPGAAEVVARALHVIAHLDEAPGALELIRLLLSQGAQEMAGHRH